MQEELMRMNQFVMVFVFLTASAAALAQDKPDYVPETEKVTATAKEPGWFPSLSASGTASFNSTSSVVGTEDGSTWALGLGITGALNWRNAGGHVWENGLKWQLTYTRTSVLDRFFKSMDSFDYTSTYLYEIPSIPWFGPYARLRLQASVFPGYTLKLTDTTVTKLNVDGSPMGDPYLVKGRKDIDLTGAFAPLTIRESAGAFAKPYESIPLNVQFRLGAGAWQVFTQGGFSIASDTPETGLTLQQMEDTIQAGGEAEVTLNGVLVGNVGYTLTAGMMYPFWTNAESSPTGLDALNTEVIATVGVKLAEWASLDYAFKALRYPLIVDEWQISNSLLLTLTAGIL